ncbi:MAG: hypothetical protein IBJ17_14505 [Reyranella sp.]|jgi:hypothetical protein|nr:hypothetical protein [Reyranella sp.]
MAVVAEDLKARRRLVSLFHVKRLSGDSAQTEGGMLTFVFRCPATGHNVQGSFEGNGDDLPSHVGQHCLACGGLHVVNPRDGRPLAAERVPAVRRKVPRQD